MSAKAPGIVERLLAERIGLDPSSVGDGLIARGVHERMSALGLRSEAEYVRVLGGSAEELQALVEEVVVPESWFLRDGRPFEVLAGFARSGWLVDPARPPLTALSLPCAGGEEPYSIAIALLDAGLPAGRFRVDAADVSARSLARAVAGVYGPNSFRGPAAAVRSTHFREQDGAFTLDLAVRSTVHFRQGNLLDPALFADRPPFDVVFCRNLLIYLDDESTARALANLGRLVADGGLLFLGHADRVEQPGGSPFEATGDKGSFAYRKGPARPSKPFADRRVSRAAIDPSSSPLPPGEGPGMRAGASSGAPRTRAPGGSADAARPHPGPLPGGEGGRNSASHRPLDEGKKLPPSSEALDRASELADQGRYDEATALVEGVVRDGGSCARASFLLGLIAQASGSRDRAEGHYLKAIYLDPRHDEALLALALLARRKGDIAGEAAYRRRAERVLARKDAP